jgi:hypothetical protein
MQWESGYFQEGLKALEKTGALIVFSRESSVMKLRDTALICTAILLAGGVIAVVPRLFPQRAAEPKPQKKVAHEPAPLEKPKNHPEPPGSAPLTKDQVAPVAAIEPKTAPSEGTLVVKTMRDTVMPPNFRLYIDGKIVGGQKVESYFLTGSAAQILWMGPSTYTVAEWDRNKSLQIAKLPVPQTIPYQFKLKPGTYVVEAALMNLYLPAYGRAHMSGVVGDFPLAFRQKSVTVEAGKTVEIEFDVSARFLKHPDEPKKCREWLALYQAAVESFRRDVEPLVSAFAAVRDQFRNLPGEQAVWVSLPQLYGGRRQLDWQQVWAIADWIPCYQDSSYHQKLSVVPLPLLQIPPGLVIGAPPGTSTQQEIADYLAEDADRKRLLPELTRIMTEFRRTKANSYQTLKDVALELERVKK